MRSVTCPGCRTRNNRIGGRERCAACSARLPRLREPSHRKVLRDLGYDGWADISQEIHGGEWGACCFCGKPNAKERHHDHKTGLPIGITCRGNNGCNKLLGNLTLEQLRSFVAGIERANAYYLKGIDDAAT
jgi:hypothetical protein